jgi:type I restriction enzyme S subunit
MAVTFRHRWPVVRVGDVLKLINGRAFKPSEWRQSGTPIIRIQNLNDANAPFNYYTGDLPPKFEVKTGDLLFAWSGTPGTSFGAHIWRGERAWLNQHIFKVVFDASQFDSRFLQGAINKNLTEYILAAHGAAGLAHITKGRFENSQLVCPTLGEQRRIVAEIEKQLTRLDAAIESTIHARRGLLAYRRGVLNASCRGRLIHLRELEKNHLPSSWSWSTIGSLLREPLRNGHSAKASTDGRGLRAFTLSSVTTGDFSERNTKLTVAVPEKVRGLWAEPGDLYVERSNTPELVGTTRLYRGPNDFAFIPDLLIRIRLSEVAMPEYIEICMQTDKVRSYLRSRAQGISGSMPKIDQETVSGTPIPLPPISQQREIVEEVERRFDVLSRVERSVTFNLKHAEALRQSILQKAFSGQL